MTRQDVMQMTRRAVQETNDTWSVPVWFIDELKKEPSGVRLVVLDSVSTHLFLIYDEEKLDMIVERCSQGTVLHTPGGYYWDFRRLTEYEGESWSVEEDELKVIREIAAQIGEEYPETGNEH